MIKDLQDNGGIEEAKDYSGGFAERFLSNWQELVARFEESRIKRITCSGMICGTRVRGRTIYVHFSASIPQAYTL